MQHERKPIIVGNWKMNKTVTAAEELAAAVAEACRNLSGLEVGIAPTFPALSAVSKKLAQSSVLLVAQNCHPAEWGAYTGEISVAALRDVGCNAVIIGHSERRQYFGESDHFVNEKAKKALAGGIVPIVCVGETQQERDAGATFDVIAKQVGGCLDGIPAEQSGIVVIAYEPVWAIGTGKTATKEQAQEVHRFIRERLGGIWGREAEKTRIQYGGSVKPANIRELMEEPDIDGALVGGASLDADSFAAILSYKK